MKSVERLHFSKALHCAKNEISHWEFLQLMWSVPQETADLVTFIKEILNGKLHFLFSMQCVKRARTLSFSGLHFAAFRQNTEIYKVNLYIQSECGKMRTKHTLNTDTFMQCWTATSIQLNLIDTEIIRFKNHLKKSRRGWGMTTYRRKNLFSLSILREIFFSVSLGYFLNP